MKLNHLSLSVPDVAITASFFKTYFQFEEIDSKGSNIIIVLKGNDGFILVLTKAKTDESPYPVDFHFGFLLDEQQEVRAIFNRLKQNGFIEAEAPSKIRNSFGFYLKIPGDVLMEISCAI
jgi:catechol-2,3-dioxygenase